MVVVVSAAAAVAVVVALEVDLVDFAVVVAAELALGVEPEVEAAES